ncbi:MAG TPA: hypothetical protein VGC07_01565 [Granulicella sp.]
MAKGWESKSVEEQQSQATSRPVDTTSAKREEASLKRERQALEMQRERILSERTSSPHRRSALETALADIEARLTELGWSIHM